jgi:hypothetical protein
MQTESRGKATAQVLAHVERAKDSLADRARGIRERRPPRGLTGRLVKVGHASSAAAAAQAFPQFDCWKIFAIASDVVGGEEDTPVFAPAADRNERHLGFNELAKRAADGGLAIAWAHRQRRPDPGQRGRSLGPINSPPKRSWNCTACARSAKQKTFMSISSRRKE